MDVSQYIAARNPHGACSVLSKNGVSVDPRNKHEIAKRFRGLISSDEETFKEAIKEAHPDSRLFEEIIVSDKEFDPYLNACGCGGGHAANGSYCAAGNGNNNDGNSNGKDGGGSHGIDRIIIFSSLLIALSILTTRKS